MKLNGRTIALKQEQTLLAFLEAEHFNYKNIAVELNGVIIPKIEYEKICLSEEDTLEIVQFVGGG